MATFSKTVVDVYWKTKGKGRWVVAETVDKGKKHDSNIFDKEAQKMLAEKGPGLYDFDMSKGEGDQYWNVNGIKWKGPLSADDRKADQQWKGGSSSNGHAPAPAGLDPVAERARNKVTITAALMSATAAIVAAGIQTTADKKDAPTLKELVDETWATLAEKAEAYAKGAPKAEEPKTALEPEEEPA